MKQRWTVYIVRCADGSLYTGVTTSVERRLNEHNSKRGSRYTRSFGPVSLVWQAAQPNYSSALRREAQIKRLSRQEKIALVTRDSRL